MKKALLLLGLLVLPAFLAAQEIVEKVEIVGNDRVTNETVLYYLTVREGDLYSEDQFRRRTSGSSGRPVSSRTSSIEEAEGTRGKIVTDHRRGESGHPGRRLQDGEEGQGRRHRRQAQGEGPVHPAVLLLQRLQGPAHQGHHHRAPLREGPPGRRRSRPRRSSRGRTRSTSRSGSTKGPSCASARSSSTAVSRSRRARSSGR